MSLHQGELAEVDIVISDASDAISVFDIAVQFDPTVINLTSSNFPTSLGDIDLNEVLANVDLIPEGQVVVYEFSLLGASPGLLAWPDTLTGLSA